MFTFKEGRVIYLHCLAGIGRTGTVLGCHFVRHGLSGEEALHLIVKRRWGNPYADMTSPETNAQRDFVRQWQPGR
ncbi:MAG: dual specificity protein phosphatase family protein [Ardenticatenales bacterium]|nr:dual specificity protein phosphatase family protein [Ardenticatenales bacterium]